VIRSALLGAVAGLEHAFGTRAEGIWTPEAETAKLHQVHGAAVVRVSAPGHFGDGDALVTDQPGLWLEIRTADCVPLLIADPARRVVAAVHAGWRGTDARIAAAAVGALAREWGSRPSELLVAIGPSIGGCCFAVGEEVAARFAGHITRTEPQACVDLVSANREQLAAAGVEQIDALGLCTVCEPERFHSFRRDKGAGRMVAGIRLL